MSLVLVDDGVDLVTDKMVRIQVKSARLRKTPGLRTTTHYNWNFKRWGSQSTPVGIVDFFVLWGIDTDNFWVVPATLIAGVANIAISFGQIRPMVKARKRKLDDYLSAWHLISKKGG